MAILNKGAKMWKGERRTNTGRTEKTHTQSQLLADMRSIANHNSVVNGISDRRDDRRRQAEFTHGYMSNQRKNEYL